MHPTQPQPSQVDLPQPELPQPDPTPPPPSQTPESAAAHPARRRTTWIVLAAVVGVLTLVGLATGRSDIDRPLQAEPLRVAVLTVTSSPGYTVLREFTGRLEARRESAVGFEREGALEVLHVEEGDTVVSGTLLAELDRDRLRAERRELVAIRDQVAAEVELARSTRDRVAAALALDAVSTQEDDEASTAVRAKQAALARAEAAIERLDVELGKSRLTAPFDALVAERLADEGQVVAAGRPLLRLLEQSAPEARIAVAGPAVAQLTVGASYRLEIEGRTLDATLRAVLPVRRAGTRSVEALFTLDTDLGSAGLDTEVQTTEAHGVLQLRRGDLVRLPLETSVDTTGFWLPMSALTESTRGLWAALVARPATSEGAAEGAATTVERRELEVLHQEADRVFVRGALQDGEWVVADGLHRLVPGQAVHAELAAVPAAPGSTP